MKTVLHICANEAIWICFNRGTVVDYFAEPIVDCFQKNYEPCHWLHDKRAEVHLLVDCEQTEIDAYPLQEAGTNWHYRSNKKALQENLLSRFPDAIIRADSKNSGLGAVLVQHVNLPESINGWLSHVEKSGVVFCSITTTVEALANRWTKANYDDGIVVVNASSQFVRHSYCRSGHALFARAMANSESIEAPFQLKQTLSHLNSSALIEQAVPVYCIGLNSEVAESLDRLELVSKVVCVDEEDDFASQCNISNKKDHPKILLAGWVLANARLRTNHSNRQVTYTLSKYLQQSALKRKKVQRYTLAPFFLLSLAFTLNSERQRAQKVEQFEIRKKDLIAVISSYQQDANELIAQSSPLSEALLNQIALESVTSASPAVSLALLAHVFTKHRAMQLHELQWVVVESSEQAKFVELQSDDSAVISARAELPAAGAYPSVNRISITGSVVLGNSLREQQSAFSAFAAYLQQQNEVKNLKVLKTPIMLTDKSAHISAIESPSRPEFQIQFDLHRSLSGEA